MGAEVNRFGPVLAQARIGLGPDNARCGNGSAVDDRGGFDGAHGGDGSEHRLGKRRALRGILLVEVKARRFPVFVHAEGKIEIWLTAEPRDVVANFGRPAILIITIQIDAVAILPGCRHETGRVEEWADKPPGAVVEDPRFEQRQEGERRRGFVSVDTGRKINPRSGAGRAFGERDEGRAGVFTETVEAEARGATGRLEAGDEGGRVEGRFFHRRNVEHGMNWLRGENPCCRIGLFCL